MAQAKKRAKKRSKTTIERVVDTVDELGLEILDVSRQLKALEERKRSLAKELTTLLRDAGAKTIEHGMVRVTVYDAGSRSKLDELKLLRAGVGAKVIARCKVTSPPSYNVKVSALKEPSAGKVIREEST